MLKNNLNIPERIEKIDEWCSMIEMGHKFNWHEILENMPPDMLELKGTNGKSILICAQQNNNQLALNALYSLALQRCNDAPYCAIICHQNIQEIEQLATEKGSLLKDIRFIFGETPLTLACRSGHADLVHYLIEQGAELNEGHGITALSNAIAYDYHEIVAALVKAGADVMKQICPDSSYSYYRSAIHFAAQRGNEKIMRTIIETLPDALNQCDHLLKIDEHADREFFLAKGGKPIILKGEWQSDNNITRYLLNVSWLQNNIVISIILPHNPILYEAFLKMATGTSLRDTGLINIIQSGYSAFLLDLEDHKGRTPLLLASLYSRGDIVRYLINKGANKHILFDGQMLSGIEGPLRVGIFYARGMAYHIMGQFYPAFEYLNRALQNDPKHAPTHVALEQLLKKIQPGDLDVIEKIIIFDAIKKLPVTSKISLLMPCVWHKMDPSKQTALSHRFWKPELEKRLPGLSMVPDKLKECSLESPTGTLNKIYKHLEGLKKTGHPGIDLPPLHSIINLSFLKSKQTEQNYDNSEFPMESMKKINNGY